MNAPVSMKFRPIVLPLLIIALFAIIGTAVYFLRDEKNTVHIPVRYGDGFPDVEALQADTVASVQLPFEENYNVVFYLSQSCSVCVQKLPDYKRILDTYEHKAGFVFLWEDTIPLKSMESNQIPIESNYYLNEKYSLSHAYPAYFITDKQKKVIFSTLDFDAFSNKLRQIS